MLRCDGRPPHPTQLLCLGLGTLNCCLGLTQNRCGSHMLATAKSSYAVEEQVLAAWFQCPRRTFRGRCYFTWTCARPSQRSGEHSRSERFQVGLTSEFRIDFSEPF